MEILKPLRMALAGAAEVNRTPDPVITNIKPYLWIRCINQYGIYRQVYFSERLMIPLKPAETLGSVLLNSKPITDGGKQIKVYG